MSLLEVGLGRARTRIVDFIREKVMNFDGVVVGISGGIDSAATAYLCVEALGSKRVLGLLMPDVRVTPSKDIEDAKLVARELNIKTKFIDIAPIHASYMRYLDQSRIAEGNLRARIRMSLLYYHANLLNLLVAGTGDRSEILLGYFTKYGDGGVDFLPIGDLYKTEVKKLGELLGINRSIILKESSPRLWPEQTAELELGMSYDKVDEILSAYYDDNMTPEAISERTRISLDLVKSILNRCKSNEHKRKTPEICYVRKNL